MELQFESEFTTGVGLVVCCLISSFKIDEIKCFRFFIFIWLEAISSQLAWFCIRWIATTRAPLAMATPNHIPASPILKVKQKRAASGIPRP